jgi:hypothetical protein
VPYKDLRVSFGEKVDRSPGQGPKGDCHMWTAAVTHTGYGHVYYEGRVRRAHRVAWHIEHGEWPELCVLHRCDERLCVNPAHLWLGTRADNIVDMDAKGRRITARGEGHGFAKLTEADVRAIRSLRGVERQVDIAARYGISYGHVSMIQRRKKWAHVA